MRLLLRPLIHHAGNHFREALHGFAVGHDLLGHRFVGAARFPDRARNDLFSFAVGELVEACVVAGLEGDFAVFESFVADAFGVGYDVGVGEFAFEDFVHLFDDLREECLFAVAGASSLEI